MKSLKVMYFNARSLKNKLDELMELANKHVYDVIAVVETWLKPDFTDAEFNIPGYNIYRSDRVSSRCGGGVAVYFKDHLHVEVLNRFQEINGMAESLWCHLKTTTGLATIGVIYRSPTAIVYDVLDQIKCFGTANDLIILGDLNAPDINWDDLSAPSTGFQKDLLDSILDLNLVQHVNQDTRICLGQKPSLIDLVLSPRPADIENMEVGDPIGQSDHCTLCFYWVRGHSARSIRTEKKAYWKMDVGFIRETAEHLDWEVSPEKDIEQNWSKLRENIRVLDDLVPLRSIRVMRSPPWFDQELRGLMRRRKKLWNAFRLNPSNESYHRYRVIRNECTALKRLKRGNYEENLAMESVGVPKRLFAYIRRRTKVRSSVPTLQDDDNQSAESDYGKAMLLAEQYASVYSSEQSPSPQLDLSSDVMPDVVLHEDLLRSIMVGLDANSSPGPDGIHPSLLKSLCDVLCAPFR